MKKRYISIKGKESKFFDKMKKTLIAGLLVGAVLLGTDSVMQTQAYSWDSFLADTPEDAHIASLENQTSTSVNLVVESDEKKPPAYSRDTNNWSANMVYVYRSETKDGEYSIVKRANVADCLDYNKIYITDKNLAAKKQYFYKIQTVYKNSNGEVTKGKLSESMSIWTMGKVSEFTKIKAIKAKTFKVVWKKSEDIDGVDLYIANEKNTPGDIFENQYFTVGTGDMDYDISKLKVYKSYSNKTISMTYKKAKHGKDYFFILRPYIKVNGKKIQGNTIYVGKKSMDYYFCPKATDGKFFVIRPKTQKKCAAMTKVVRVKTWDYVNHKKHKGRKKTKVLSIRVNKGLAATVKQIFKEIYKHKSKPVIYEAGSYRWRTGEKNYWSNHTIGAAIDMNVNENPYYSYVNGKKKATVGKFYKPKTNPYSIPRHGVIENTFNKYGFTRLDHDLMHFEAIIDSY